MSLSEEFKRLIEERDVAFDVCDRSVRDQAAYFNAAGSARCRE